MRFFPRLFLSHLLVSAVAVAGLFLAAELFALGFSREHVRDMVEMMGPEGAGMQRDLERGMRDTLTRALVASVPLAVLAASLTAYASSRRVVRQVERLRRGSLALAQGQYRARIDEAGNDEFAELAHNFNVMAGALERVEQGRTELIGNVAHELRAPLSALHGYAEALEDGVLSPGRAGAAINREVGAMDRLVRDLSLVSKVEAGQVELRLQEVHPLEVLGDIREWLAAAFEEKGVELVNAGAAWPAVHADRERVRQVLTNLLSNALRHTPPGGAVTVTATPGERRLRLTVSDTGSGIAPEHLPRVFERFYRADPARSRIEGGSGVGLTIARGLVEAMGGRLTVRSEPGAGSAFTVELPLYPRGPQEI